MDEKEYFIDENGHDVRYGTYFGDMWAQDPPMVIAMKRTGEWYKLLPIQQRWVRDSCFEDTYGNMAKLNKECEEISRKLKEKWAREDKLAKKK
jgi:hypothetical protein